jgi:hypothetical protein
VLPLLDWLITGMAGPDLLAKQPSLGPQSGRRNHPRLILRGR